MMSAVRRAPKETAAVEPPSAAVVTTGEWKISHWKPRDVMDWLKRIGLQRYLAKFEKIDGVILRELFTMFERAPETYYRTVEHKLGFYDSSHVADMLVFTYELRNLSLLRN